LAVAIIIGVVFAFVSGASRACTHVIVIINLERPKHRHGPL
jgi:hypothetical protein